MYKVHNFDLAVILFTKDEKNRKSNELKNLQKSLTKQTVVCGKAYSCDSNPRHITLARTDSTCDHAKSRSLFISAKISSNFA